MYIYLKIIYSNLPNNQNIIIIIWRYKIMTNLYTINTLMTNLTSSDIVNLCNAMDDGFVLLSEFNPNGLLETFELDAVDARFCEHKPFTVLEYLMAYRRNRAKRHVSFTWDGINYMIITHVKYNNLLEDPAFYSIYIDGCGLADKLALINTFCEYSL